MAATNINVGRDHREPDQGSRAALHTQRDLGLQAARRGQQPPQGRQSGEWVDKPNYFDVTVWGAQGENCANYLSKGRPVAVQGRLDWREWETQEGQKRQAVEIIAEQRPVPRLARRQPGPGRQGNGNGFEAKSDVPADTSDFQEAGVASGGRAGGGGDDDIPF